MILSEIKIEKRGRHWHVVNEHGVVGRMYDFYSNAKKVPISLARNPFPFNAQTNKYETQDDAQKAMQRLKSHVEAVLAMPVKNRNGASQWWKK